jgi:rare lipoprotein A
MIAVPKTALVLSLVAALALASSCGPRRLPPGDRVPAAGWDEEGIASWYGKKFHGRRTANGERYDMYGISAAHKSLPFGTVVLVRNMNNGRELEVRINDRGPFVTGRIIDLSYGAARKLDMIRDGIVPVRIRVVR